MLFVNHLVPTGHIAMSPPQSRLYLKLTEFGGDGTFMACVEAALQAGDVAALLIGAEVGVAPGEGAKGLLAVAHVHDVALIVDQDYQLAKALGADGVQVGASVEDYAEARAALGDEMIVGIAKAPSRHIMMELAEAGASYVSFDDDASDPDSLSAWWAEVMEVPCVTHLAGHNDEVLSAVNAGIEFISPDETMWQSPQHASETVRRLNDLIGKDSVAA